MTEGTGRRPERLPGSSSTSTPRALDSIAISWYRWRLLSGYYDTREVLSVIAARLTDPGARRA